MQCLICADKNINTVFLNCGHMTYCDNCAKTHNINKCPICSKNGKYIKTYWSGYEQDQKYKLETKKSSWIDYFSCG